MACLNEADNVERTSRLIFCERQGRWAASLRRVWPEMPTTIVETRGYDECFDAVKVGDVSLVALEATPDNIAKVCRWVWRFRNSRPASDVVALSQPSLERWQWLWREAGAMHVIHCRRELETVRDLAIRHFELHPAPKSGVAAELLGRLPWGETAN